MRQFQCLEGLIGRVRGGLEVVGCSLGAAEEKEGVAAHVRNTRLLAQQQGCGEQPIRFGEPATGGADDATVGQNDQAGERRDIRTFQVGQGLVGVFCRVLHPSALHCHADRIAWN